MECWGRFADIGDDFWAVMQYAWDIPWGAVGDFDPAGDVIVPPAGEFTAVEVGARHGCAIDKSGSVACWGHEHDQPYDYDPSRVCDWDEGCLE